MKIQKNGGRGAGAVVGVQGGCDRTIEVFWKMRKKSGWGFGRGQVGVGGGGGGSG